MKLHFSNLIIVCILAFTACNTKNKQQNEQQVYKGSFGIDFGTVYDIKNTKTITRQGELMYEITPPKKIEFFDKYYVAITPKTHKIYAIYAIKEYPDSSSRISSNDQLDDIMYKKYGAGKYTSGNSSYFTDYGFINISASIADLYKNPLEYYFLCTYVESLAEQERIQNIKNKDAL